MDAPFIVCGISRDYCDNMFGKCLKKKCGKDQQCKANADLMKLGTNIFGCQPFLDGQKEGCQCLDAAETTQYRDAVFESLTNYYQTLSDVEQSYGKTDQEISTLIEKYVGKEDKVLFGIINKYNKHLIRKTKMDL